MRTSLYVFLDGVYSLPELFSMLICLLLFHNFFQERDPLLQARTFEVRPIISLDSLIDLY